MYLIVMHRIFPFDIPARSALPSVRILPFVALHHTQAWGGSYDSSPSSLPTPPSRTLTAPYSHWSLECLLRPAFHMHNLSRMLGIGVPSALIWKIHICWRWWWWWRRWRWWWWTYFEQCVYLYEQRREVKSPETVLEITKVHVSSFVDSECRVEVKRYESWGPSTS